MAEAELKALRTVNASLQALNELAKAIQKDLTVVKENLQSLTHANEKWEILLSEAPAEIFSPAAAAP
eukprot:m.248889 g.248889  ORF g.248889 m.248889 type:complete len:67 (+) comp15880_c0_seq1:145-345(+)